MNDFPRSSSASCQQISSFWYSNVVLTSLCPSSNVKRFLLVLDLNAKWLKKYQTTLREADILFEQSSFSGWKSVFISEGYTKRSDVLALGVIFFNNQRKRCYPTTVHEYNLHLISRVNSKVSKLYSCSCRSLARGQCNSSEYTFYSHFRNELF